MQFSNTDFKTIYYLIIDHLNQSETFSIDNFIQRIDPKLSAIITSILMNDERYRLHNWEKNNKLITKDVYRYQDGSRNSILFNLIWTSVNSGSFSNT